MQMGKIIVVLPQAEAYRAHRSMHGRPNLRALARRRSVRAINF
jgi:hypothetical protein